jgi:hypothetical protein
MSPRTVAVVVHWQDPEATLACVASLAREPELAVLVVDNGGRTPIAAALAARAPAAGCITSPVNRGYAGGANLGIAAALERGAEFVLVLNDDVEVRGGANAAALDLLDRDGRIAAVGPKVLSRADPGRLWLAWGDVTYRQSLVALHGAGEPDGPAFAAQRDVDWIAGCALWLRAATLRQIGAFDEAFFAYHEEVDWCARARAAGWRVVYAPQVVVTHGGRGSSAERRSVRIRKYFAARNTVLFARKHASLAERAKLAAHLAISLPLELVWHWPRGRADEVRLKLRGVLDGLFGRRPPFEALDLR